MPKNKLSQEQLRLSQKDSFPVQSWRKWGPYVAERAWGTVREDYSPDGNAWNYFPFQQSTYKAYRWGEDGIAGFCDRYQVLVFSWAFWNGKDPILKERLFGLSSTEGNHGEDVKECYFYLDGTPTHSYMKYLYKYPQNRFPYEKLIEENKKRSAKDPEYELIDTGAFCNDEYFDIFIEYAKTDEEEICIKLQAYNRAGKKAHLSLFPELLFRNQWSWGDESIPRPCIYAGEETKEFCSLVAEEQEMPPPSNLSISYRLGKRYLYASPEGICYFTNNDTRFPGQEKPGEHYKDAFHKKVIEQKEAIHPENKGSKACIRYDFPSIDPGKSVTIYLKLTDKKSAKPLGDIEKIIALRKEEADEFYDQIHPKKATKEERAIQRQAWAGLCWNKQIYLFDVNLWLKGDSRRFPPPSSHGIIRNVHWRHLNSMRILSMPDKWEYPWFAAWDQAYHCIAWSLIDLSFAKEQLWLLLFDQFQHPNGQIPSYEWEFSDLNPPIQGWVALKLYFQEKEKMGKGDRDFLEKCFHKLLMNFSWWVNKVDSSGNNVFEGGFLGLDNIAVLDRSQKLPHGVKLQQSDGTGWMAFFCLNLMRMAMELAKENEVYESLATKFFEHYVYIAQAMKKRGGKDYNLWSDTDGFFYDVLTYPDESYAKFKVRSLVGIIPLYAVEVLTKEEIESLPEFHTNFEWFMKNRKALVESSIITKKKKGKEYYILTPVSEEQMKSLLQYIWDPEEFRSDFGIRSLSRYHEKNPFVFEERKVSYEPAESSERIKGGNSNWRGPIWMPTSFLLVETLKTFSTAFGDDWKVGVKQETPVSIMNMADSFSERLLSIFTTNESGARPFWGQDFCLSATPYWKDLILFYEYFHPETGKGFGASHQCGWTALIANLIQDIRC